MYVRTETERHNWTRMRGESISCDRSKEKVIRTLYTHTQLKSDAVHAIVFKSLVKSVGFASVHMRLTLLNQELTVSRKVPCITLPTIP